MQGIRVQSLVGKLRFHMLRGMAKKGKRNLSLDTKWSEVKVTQSCLPLCDPMDYTIHGILQARILEWVPFPNTGVGSLSLLQGIFPTQGSNPGLSHCRRILYQLSHKGSPTILEWVAYPISSGSSWPRNRTGVSCNADSFFTNWAIRAHLLRPYSSHSEVPGRQEFERTLLDSEYIRHKNYSPLHD